MKHRNEVLCSCQCVTIIGGEGLENTGFDTETGGVGLLFLASCLQMGQKARHFVSHESMHCL